MEDSTPPQPPQPASPPPPPQPPAQSGEPSPQPAAQPAGPPAQAAMGGITPDEKNMGLLAHLLGFCGFVIPFGNIIGPLVIYLTKKDSSAYIRHHAVEALNFQISLTIYFIVSFLLVFVFIGMVLIPALLVIQIVFIVLAAIKASEGQYYRYPLTIRMMT